MVNKYEDNFKNYFYMYGQTLAESMSQLSNKEY